MTQVLVTGADGFLGRNLTVHLKTLEGVQVIGADVCTPDTELNEALKQCDVIFHLAGVNRPSDPSEFRRVNRDFTEEVCERLRGLGRQPKVVFSSSIQAALDNPYGASKREAEELLRRFGADTGADVRIYRLNNVFGKWCRPNYNSAVATFCHNIANDLAIQISDPSRNLELVYVDDVVKAFLADLPIHTGANGHCDIPSFKLTLGDLAGLIQSFHDMRTNLLTPDFAVRFNQQLYATYLSYVPDEALRQQLQIKSDQRGGLAEFIKSNHFGQIFISRTRPGITRGNHYHHTKTEKFFVVEGEGIVRMRQIESPEVVEYRVRGEASQVIDIPPGCTHSIENIGSGDMVTLFWASEIFDPDRPDTYFLPVLAPAQSPVPVTT
jgi:UDP-2-acetamido-2,6-beta-L-arabino-hexul-4-ose reductase